MLLKMRPSVSKLALGMFRMWKNLEKRIDSLARDPVGGAAQQTVTILLTTFFSLLARSYNAPNPINWRMSSTGGCASYTSCSGMFTSSIIRMPFTYPADGPITFLVPTPLNLSSINFCVM